MKVAAINLPHSLTPAEAAHDAELVFGLVGPDGVVLACEVDKSNDEPFQQAAARDGKRAHFRRRKTQVATPRKWTEVVAMQRTLTDAMAGVNPGRDLNGVADCDRRTIYWSVHLPNGKDKPGKSFRAWRAFQWSRFVRRANRQLSKWHDRGWHQVIGGDINDPHGATFHPAQESVAHAGLMHIYAIPAPGYRLEHGVEEFVTRRNKGDHPVVVATDLAFKEIR